MSRAFRSSSTYPVTAFLRVDAASRAPGARRLRPALLALSIAAAFTSLPTASQSVLPVWKADVVGTSSRVTNAAGTQLTVTTTNGVGANHSAINWQSFSIGAGNTTNILQPSTASMSINRVVTNAPSQIYGTLWSNGKVVLVNQSGITVGAGAVVDTAGFTASVLGMSEADAAAGRLRFNADGLGQANGALRVEGNIIARGGDVVLIAPSVEVAKTAVVEAKDGAAILAAGQQVEITGRGLEGIRLTVQAPSDEAVNLGTLKGDAVGIFAGRLKHSGLIQAGGASVEGGKVVLKALDVAEVSGAIEARRTSLNTPTLVTAGGDVTVSARYAVVTGAIDATGPVGGTVNIDAQAVLQAGSIDVSGTQAGGTAIVRGSDSVVQTSAATVKADAGAGSGGLVVVQSGDTGTVMTSATLSASGAGTGSTGGKVQVLGGTVRLQAAQLTADGDEGGGTLLVGGGKGGKDPTVPNSHDLYVNSASVLSASARRRGQGGTVVLWSDGQTRFFGDIAAQGAGLGEAGGFVEVSGLDGVQFGGMVNAAGGPGGDNGTLLLDPHNITIGAAPGQLGVIELADPNKESSGAGDFGSTIFDLSNNRVLVTDPYDNAGGSNAGAIYVFDKASGALISALTGSHASDGVGSNYQYVYDSTTSSYTYLFKASSWNGGVGAWTWFSSAASASLPASGVVSAANSLVGLSVGDLSSAYLNSSSSATSLLIAPNYAGGKGAAAMVSSTAGFAGTFDTTNALMGSTTTDHVGSGGTVSVAGSTLLLSPQWNSDAGAITVLPATLSGTISSANSLVGAAAGDSVGDYGSISQFSSGRIMLTTRNWGGGLGAFTVFDNPGAMVGTVTSANSLTGTSTSDGAGFQIQNCQSYYGCSYYYSGSAEYFVISNPTLNANGGSVTVLKDVAAASQPVGTISSANSLVGAAGDSIGSGGVTVISPVGPSSLLIQSPQWNGGMGALTYQSLSSVPVGQVDASNSIVGTAAGDLSGMSLRSDYVLGGSIALLAPNYEGGKGALALLAPGAAGTLTTANALMGSATTDHIGNGGLSIYGNNDYWVLKSYQWNSYAGAISIFEPDAFPVGTISGGTNSWVGANANDQVGYNLSFTLMASHDAVVINPNWGGGKGAITLITDLAMPYGTISSANSLIGSTSSDGGGMTATAYESDGYRTSTAAYTQYVVVNNPAWNGDRGFVTLIGAYDGALASTGYISSSNSLVGAASGDRVGSSISTMAGSQPTLVIRSPDWNGGKGAITFATLASGGLAGREVGGVGDNSILGQTAGDLSLSNAHLYVQYSDGYGLDGYYDVPEGRVLLVAPQYGGGYGAIASFAASSPPSGTLSSSNALVGAASGDHIGSGGMRWLYNSSAYGVLLLSPDYGSSRGAVTVIDTAVNGPTGTLGSGNSFVGANAGDRVGGSTDDTFTFDNGGLLLFTPSYASGSGAMTLFADPMAAGAVTGTLGSGNSLVGSTAGDFSGYQVQDYYHGGNYNQAYVRLPNWTNTSASAANAGAIVAVSAGGTAPTGTISSANALVGTHADDRVGSDYIDTYGNYGLLTSADWNGGRGYLGFTALGSALTGTIDAPTGANLILGLSSGDLYSYSLASVTGDRYTLIASGYDGGKGAIYNLDAAAAYSGGTLTLNSGNALVGANAGDHIGSNGYYDIGSGLMIGSPSWSSATGALTFSDASGMFATGVVGAGNSLVGAAAGDRIGYSLYDSLQFANGKLLLINRMWGIGSSTASSGKGAITLLQNPYQASGVIDASNSLVGTVAGDGGNFSLSSYDDYGNTYYYYAKTRGVLYDASFNGNRGMATIIDSSLSSSPAGVIGAANSLVGTNAGDYVGQYVDVNGTGVTVRSTAWNNNTGAITFGSLSSLATGEVSSGNSLVGAQAGDRLGYNSVYSVNWSDDDGTHVMRYTTSPYLNGNVGGVTFIAQGATTGVLSAANTVYDTTTGGSYPSVYSLGNGNFQVRFSNGSGRVLYVNAQSLGSAGTGSGAITPTPQGGLMAFDNAAASDVTITPQAITAMTNNGTDVLLQANNDILVNAAITTTPGSGGAGTLGLEAGRGIQINANITTGGGDLALVANSAGATAAHRDAGLGGIVAAPGVTLSLGGGELLAKVDTGVDGAQGGSIFLGAITGASAMFAQNLSTTPNAGIAQQPGTVWETTLLGMQTSANGGAIGTLAQSIHFAGIGLAVQTADGPANIAHIGSQLYLDVPPSLMTPAQTTNTDLTLDPGFRGIQLGGNGSLDLTSTGDVNVMSFSGQPIAISARNVSIETPGSVYVSAGDVSAPAGQQASLPAEKIVYAAGIVASGQMYVSAGHDVFVHGGSADRASAAIVSAGDATIIAGGTLNIHGGSGSGAYALVDPTAQGSTMDIGAQTVSLQGGSGAGAYAAVASVGNLTLGAQQLNLTPGSGAGADAVILAPNAQTLGASYGKAYLGAGNPLLNASTEAGFGTLVADTAPVLQQFTADANFISGFLENYNDALLAQRRRERRGDIVLEETCK